MNKIYKVIWSKTRNCYVAVAEFVKRNGKGGSVLNRRHIAAALKKLQQAVAFCDGLRLAAPFTCRHVAAVLATVAICAAPAGAMAANSGGHWDGDDYIGDAPYNVTINEQVNGIAYGRYETGNVGASGATLSIVDGGKADVAFGGRAASGAVTGNKVIMTGGEILEGNSIKIKNKYASGNINVSGMLFGGFADNGNAEKNTVEISGGTVNRWLIGGFSWNGEAANNTVILSKEKEAPVLNGTLFGGYGNGMAFNNTLQVEAVGLSAPEIRNFENYKFVFPKDIKAGDTMLTLKSQINNLEIDATKISVSSNVGKTGLNLNESITLLHKTDGSGAFSVTNLTGAVQTSKLDEETGGFDVMKYTLENPADKLNVTVSELYLYGDGGTNMNGQREIGNTLTIKSGKANAAFGGRAKLRANENSVTMEGGELVLLADQSNPNYNISGNLYGGYAGDINDQFFPWAIARDNTVKISGGKVERAVYGGYSDFPNDGGALGNTVEISGGTIGGTVLNAYVYGGYTKNGNATGNTVVISGGTVGGEVSGRDRFEVYGGYAQNGNATGNTVVISGGTIGKDVYGEGGTQVRVYGGYSKNGNATGNTVVLGEGLTGRTFGTLYLYGSNKQSSDNTLRVEGRNIYVRSIGGFENYTVILPQSVQAGDTILACDENMGDLILDGSRVRFVSGGRLGLNLGESVTVLKARSNFADTYGEFLLNNADQIPPLTERLDNEGTGFVTLAGKTEMLSNTVENKLNLTVTEKFLYGDGGTNTPGQRETDNALTITGGKANAAFGGRATTNDVTGNKVEMSGGELVRLSDSSDPDYSISGNLYGGYTDKGNAQGNTVEMSGGKVESSLYGGYTKSGMAGGDKPEDGNKVSMTGGEANEVMGGYTEDGNARYNTVSVSNAKVSHAIGGSTLEGDAVGNTVTLSNTDVAFTVIGGDGYRGRAAENTVTIESGSVGMNVFGGASISGNVENNTVSIRGGKINGVLDGLKTSLTGGYGSKRVVGNTVAITGGEIFVESVYGGYNDSGSGSGFAEKNVVTLGGGTYDAGVNIVGGGSDNEANDNAVNLAGTTAGLDGAKLYGWKETRDGATVTGTGNELHVGGTKAYDKNGNATIAKGSWQGYDSSGAHTNKVDSVSNFDSIALHNVVWGDVPALSAKNMVNIGGLDVTGLEFFTHPNDSTVHEHALSDSMVLVHSDGKALTGLNISYLDEGRVKTEALTNKGISYHSTTHHTEEKGVTVYGKEQKRIYLADHNQSVDFLYHINGEKISLGDVAFVKDGTARDLDGRFDVRNADIDADGFKMTDASMKGVEAGDTMTVLDAEDAIKAKGATATLKEFTGEGVTGGVKKYDVAFSDSVTGNLTLSGTRTDTLSQNAEKTKLTYTAGEKKVSEAAMTGELAWKDGVTHYTNKDYNFNADAKTDLCGLTFATVTTDPTGQSMTLINCKAAGMVENAPASFGVSLAKANTTLDATAAGRAAVANGDVTYSVNSVMLDKVTVNQVTAAADTVPDTWTVAKDASGKTALTIDTENMALPSGSANKEHAILTISNDSFAGATVTGQYAYASHSPFTKANGGVSFAGEKEGGVKLSDDNKSVVYHVVQDHVKDVTLGSVNFAKDATLLTVGNEYEFTKVNTVNVQNFAMNYAAPENVAVRDSMTLLQANNTLQANALLQKMAADVKTKTQPYSFAPVEGVTVAAKITGSLGTTAKGDGFAYTVNSNQADKLTFGSVDWKDGGILLTRPANITFAGADVDTSRIHFKNVHELDANKQMTLVSDFGNKTGKITGSKYYIGTTLEGEGSATLNGNDLVFTTHSSTNPNPGPTPDPTPLHAQEQTHNTVMGQTAGISLLYSGAEQISHALNSLSLLDSFGGMTGTGGTGSTTGTGTTVQTSGEGGSPAGQTGGEGGSSGQSGSGGSENSGQGQEGSGGSETGNEKGQSKESDDRNGSGNSDQQESNAEANGIIVASVGGGHESVETGSHVTSNSWNGVLGIGGKRATKKGTLQYLAFAEHGRANFTLHGDAGRGDGTSKYVGGGLIGKWQNRRDVYVEASIRAGRMHDTANHMLYDEATGRSYGYDVYANYIGGHIGIGKVFTYNNGRTLDVYGKYFHMKRDGVSFEAGGHFDLDSVTRSVLRVGARYGAANKKWNWYGGLAYEYEFDGKATGRADGAPIRAASMEGGSVRAEIGLRMEASKTSPWKADINLSGYAGERRGISGNIAVAYTF